VWLWAAGGEEAVQRAAIVAGFARAVRGAALGRGAVLRTVGLDSALGLSPQASTPPAFGVFHDLRWLMVYHSSWPAFLGEAVAAVLVRGQLSAAIVHLVWPPTAPRPGFRTTLRRSAAFTTIALVLLSPWAVVAMAGSETPLSWFFLGELLPVLFLALVLSRGGIISGWWRGLPPLAALGWALLTFAVVTVDAMLVGFA